MSSFFIQFLLFGYVFHTLISIGSVLIEEMTYRRYNDWRDLSSLVCFCFLEHSPYHRALASAIHQTLRQPM